MVITRVQMRREHMTRLLSRPKGRRSTEMVWRVQDAAKGVVSGTRGFQVLFGDAAELHFGAGVRRRFWSVGRQWAEATPGLFRGQVRAVEPFVFQALEIVPAIDPFLNAAAVGADVLAHIDRAEAHPVHDDVRMIARRRRHLQEFARSASAAVLVAEHFTPVSPRAGASVA